MKLRIPIFLLTLGITSGIVQTITNNYSLTNAQDAIITILFFVVVGGVTLLVERTGVGDKRVNIIFGLIWIGIGVVIDVMSK